MVRLSLMVDQKSNLLWRVVVAFLMFSIRLFCGRLNDTDNSDNDTDDRHHNTNNAHDNFKHPMYLSLYFPSCTTPKVLEVLKMYSFWRKANHTPFGNTHGHYTRVQPVCQYHSWGTGRNFPSAYPRKKFHVPWYVIFQHPLFLTKFIKPLMAYMKKKIVFY